MPDDTYLSAPGGVPTQAAAAFDELLAEIDRSDRATPIDLTGRVTWPIWQFLVHAAATGRYALHGSASHDIDVFEARQSNDVGEFGNRNGVYAAADGLWPFYFAIVDRDRISSLVNAAFTRIDPQTGGMLGPWYFFSVASEHSAPWREGSVYLLPIGGFERQQQWERPDGIVVSTQLFSSDPVRPLAKVRVQPEEFPLLSGIRHHDPDELARRAAQDPEGFPWL